MRLSPKRGLSQVVMSASAEASLRRKGAVGVRAESHCHSHMQARPDRAPEEKKDSKRDRPAETSTFIGMAD